VDSVDGSDIDTNPLNRVRRDAVEAVRGTRRPTGVPTRGDASGRPDVHV